MLIRKECAIHPLTNLLLLGMELGILMVHFWNWNFFNYIVLSYGLWVLAEIGIIFLHIRYKFIPQKYIAPYILSIGMIAFGVFVCIKEIAEATIYLTYIFSILPIIIWLFYLIFKKEPIHWLYLIPFTTKLIADLLSLYTYFYYPNWLIKIMCIILPIVDFLFIPVYFVKQTDYFKKQTN